MAISTLPRIVKFLSTEDCPGSQCPHCGADGRYILRFQVADGRILGAMRGCAKLFPCSPVAIEGLRLRDKATKYAKQGWKLNRADSFALDQIELFEMGQGTEQAAMSAVKSAKAQNTNRYRRR